MLKIRRPLGRLIFNMGIAIPGKTVFLIETAPRNHHRHTDLNMMNVTIEQWLSARLQYLQCISNGDVAVLHWTIDMQHVCCITPNLKLYPWDNGNRWFPIGFIGYQRIYFLKGLKKAFPGCAYHIYLTIFVNLVIYYIMTSENRLQPLNK